MRDGQLLRNCIIYISTQNYIQEVPIASLSLATIVIFGIFARAFWFALSTHFHLLDIFTFHVHVIHTENIICIYTNSVMQLICQPIPYCVEKNVHKELVTCSWNVSTGKKYLQLIQLTTQHWSSKGHFIFAIVLVTWVMACDQHLG